MQSTRAFVASLGAGMSLVAAAVSALFVLSTVVAVQGWPGIATEDDLGSVTLSRELAAAETGAPAAATPAAAPTAGAIVLGAGTGAAASPGTPGTTGGRRDGAVPAAPGTGAAPGVPGVDPGARSGAVPSSAPSGGGATGTQARPDTPASSPTAPVADAIRDTGRDLGTTTEPVVPGSGSAVQQTTDAVADVVEGGGSVVQQVIPPAAPVVGEVSERTGTAVRDTGSVVDGATSAVGSLLGRR